MLIDARLDVEEKLNMDLGNEASGLMGVHGMHILIRGVGMTRH